MMNEETSKENKPPILFDKTQPILQELEANLNGKILTYWMSPAGSVCQNDVNVFCELLKDVGKCETLYIFIKSDGGMGRASLRMVNLIREHCQRLIALVPLNCESAATMLALGADEVQMGPMAYLSPVDTSIRHELSPVDKDNDLASIGTNEMERVIASWMRHASEKDGNVYATLYEYIHPLAIAAVDRAGSLSHMLCNEIMSYHISDREKRESISRALNSDYPSHGYPIVLREAQRIGIPAVELDERINSLLISLNEIYSEMGQRCRTDFNPHHHRDNEILNIVECAGKLCYFELDKEWHYSENERTWRFTNERSTYRIRSLDGDGNEVDSAFHVR